MSKELKFEYLEDGVIICQIRDKQYFGEGIAIFRKDGIEEAPNKLVGESVAYSKAQRAIVKQKITDKKLLLKHLIDFQTYIFPPKCQEGAGWIIPRSDKRIKEVQEEIKKLEAQKVEIDESIEEYLQQRENFLKRLQRKRNANNG